MQIEEMHRNEEAAAAEASQLWTLNLPGIDPGPYTVVDLRMMLSQ